MPIFIRGIYLLISTLLIFNISCSAKKRRVDNYEDISIGMRKRDVLDTAGNPRFTDRRDGI
ncbi:MAG: hypothetical protein HRT44_12665, partial [Bdellovibrionales bacterium]|nr:hypothetical protein [Bdellovibrionales bacterium]NQZ20090.1 hypothetical protein [Bdellovibrionales bacterium]